MCGIVGYLGKKQAMPVLLDGLKRLEYRGYDSSGIAIAGDGGVESAKAVGRISELEKLLPPDGMSGSLGIAHTRWATHGKPSEANAHPHTCCSSKIWLVHNGIIENYQALKMQLESRSHVFRSETDTEAVCHLLEDLYDGDLTGALQSALKLIKGAYGLVVFHSDQPDRLLAARCGSPLVIGLGGEETIIASDVSAILRYTKQVIYLDDGEIADIRPKSHIIYDGRANRVGKRSQRVEWDLEQAEKQGFPHFMLKEIFEQGEAVTNSIRGRSIKNEGRAKFGGLETVIDKIRKVKRLEIVACGTANYAARVGKYMIEEHAGIPVEVDYASEFRYRKPILDRSTAVLAISQSGETADTLAAVREARDRGVLALGLVNVVGSTIARETDAGVYNHIGPEISVASTKAFVSQLTILALLTVLFGRQRSMPQSVGTQIISEIRRLPGKIEDILEANDHIRTIAEKYYHNRHFAFMGRKYNHPIAYEGALKLKEISYIHAEGFPSGEMKHGPIAMIDKNFPSMFIAPVDSVYEKNKSNMEEIKARGGPIIAVTTEGNKEMETIADDVIYIPNTIEMLSPILATVPLQIFAYHTAVLRGCDVDKPRNLAKSVTVE